MLDPFLSHELAVGRDLRGQRVVLVRVERDIFHLLRLLSRLHTAECLQRTRYPRRARRRSAYIPSTGSAHGTSYSFRGSSSCRLEVIKGRSDGSRERHFMSPLEGVIRISSL